MKTYICEICGDAYIGDAKPKNCPFCGAQEEYIKDGAEANPVANEKPELNEIDKKNLETTLALELNATALYICMSQKTNINEIRAMYKRLAKVEKEHASIARKLLQQTDMEVPDRECNKEDVKNFEQTVSLEKNASGLYDKFAQETDNEIIKKFFTALAVVEKEHIDLINNYL